MGLNERWDGVRDAVETPAERARFERRWRLFVGGVVALAGALALQAIAVFR